MSKQIKEFLEEKHIDSLLVVNAATQDFIEQSNSISSGNNIEDDEDTIDLRALLGTFVDGKWLILLTTIAASHGERTRGLVAPRRRRAVVLSESER